MDIERINPDRSMIAVLDYLAKAEYIVKNELQKVSEKDSTTIHLEVAKMLQLEALNNTRNR